MFFLEKNMSDTIFEIMVVFVHFVHLDSQINLMQRRKKLSISSNLQMLFIQQKPPWQPHTQHGPSNPKSEKTLPPCLSPSSNKYVLTTNSPPLHSTLYFSTQFSSLAKYSKGTANAASTSSKFNSSPLGSAASGGSIHPTIGVTHKECLLSTVSIRAMGRMEWGKSPISSRVSRKAVMTSSDRSEGSCRPPGKQTSPGWEERVVGLWVKRTWMEEELGFLG
mmetsp:Transcript_12170/g.24921  ORF Transcript_12170/g.24921 Transcript_12170/m.24921 type:complete len:221 (-) Transcript_12170:501-1163(-)